MSSGRSRREWWAWRAPRVAVASFLAFLLAGWIGAGCKLGPDYQRPEVEIPEAWRWKNAEPRDDVPREGWWRVFGDPQLDALQAVAASGNLEAQAALARVEQARSVARISRADFFPILNGSAAWTRYRTSGNAPSPVGFPIPSFTLGQFQTPLDLSYEVDLWGRVRRSFEGAVNLALGAEAARQSVLLALQADVAFDYFRLQSLDREIDLFERTVEVRGEALDIFRQRFQAGMLTEFEVQRGQVEVSSAEADLEALRRARAQVFNRLAVLCGLPPSRFDALIATNTPAPPRVAADLPSSLLERRPDVAAAERALAAKLSQIGVARGAFFPSLRLTASGGLLSGELTDLFEWESRTWSLGPSVSLPLFAGGRNRADLDRAKAAYDEAVALYRQTILVAFSEVEDALAAIQFLERETSARRVAATSAALAARQSVSRYQAGSVGFLEVVDSEEARLSNLLAHERVMREQQLATVRLLKALGGGWKE